MIIIRFLFAFAFLFSMFSCATLKWVNTNPEWNPKQGYDWAVAQCNAKKLEAYSANTINVFDESFKKIEIFNACMKSFGYEQCRIVTGQKADQSVSKNQIME